MTKYYAVDVRDVTDAATWYEQMTALGFNFEGHHRQSNFNSAYWFYFDEDKNYITYLCDLDRHYDDFTDSYEYGVDLDGAEQWFRDSEDCHADIEEFQLSTNSFYYGQL